MVHALQENAAMTRPPEPLNEEEIAALRRALDSPIGSTQPSTRIISRLIATLDAARAAREPLRLLDSWFAGHETLTRWQYAGLVGDSEKAADYQPSDAARAALAPVSAPAREADTDEAGLPITHDVHSRDWFEGYAAAARAAREPLRVAAEKVAAEYAKLRVEAGSPWLDNACAELSRVLATLAPGSAPAEPKERACVWCSDEHAPGPCFGGSKCMRNVR